MILYRILMALLLSVLAIRALVEGTLRDRLALRALPPARVWVHGASVGELASVRDLVARLAGPVLVTCNTVTARQVALGWGLPGVHVVLAPLDGGGAPGRVLAASGARTFVTVESELWPARLAACHARGVAVAVVGGRLSERSARRWQMARALARRVLAPVALVVPQDAASAARYAALGVDPARIAAVLDLKAFATAVTASGPVARAACLLAASTHEGEEALVLDALPDWARLVLLAPRHPARGAAVAALLGRLGLPFGQRSRGDPVGGARIYLADTVGEMQGWYAMAGVTVIGGTFGARGGHTPYEPAVAGSAIVHGPDVANFAAPFAALAAAGGAVATDGAGLRGALAGLTPARQAALADAAALALVPTGDLAALADAINRLAG